MLRFPMKRCSAGSELGMHRATLATHLGPKACEWRKVPAPPDVRATSRYALGAVCAACAVMFARVVSVDGHCVSRDTDAGGRAAHL